MWSIGCAAPHGPAGFLLRRVIRVAPPYWIATLAWTVFVLLAGYRWIEISPDHVALSLAFVPHFNPSFPDEIWPILVPGWTVTYEMFFYLIFAAILMAAVRLRLLMLASVLVALVSLGAAVDPEQAWAITFTSPLLLEFLGGACVAALWRRYPGGAARNALVLLGGVALLVLVGPDTDAGNLWSRTLGFGLPAILIVSGAAGLGKTLARRPLLERLGDASYAIYLFHLFVVMLMAAVWQRLPQLHGAGTAVGFVLVALVIASGLGLLIHRHVELPLQRRLMRRVSGKPPGGTA